jgi:hypothetical protein
MKAYLVWFVQTRSASEMLVEAKTRREAIELFAALHNVRASSYICARVANATI